MNRIDLDSKFLIFRDSTSIESLFPSISTNNTCFHYLYLFICCILIGIIFFERIFFHLKQEIVIQTSELYLYDNMMKLFITLLTSNLNKSRILHILFCPFGNQFSIFSVLHYTFFEYILVNEKGYDLSISNMSNH